MLSCPGYRKRLGPYLDGELSRRERIRLERHVERCDSCRAVLNSLRGLEPILQTLEVPPVPAALTSQILAEAYTRRRAIGTHPIRLWWNTFAYHPWLPKAATAVALFLGLTMGAYMGWTSYRNVASIRPHTSAAARAGIDERLYPLDVLSAAPRGSIEAAALALLGTEG